MKISMVALTDVGNVRTSNEDAYGIYEKKQVAIVCDGMGGHNAGAKASRMALETIAKYFFHSDALLKTILEDIPPSIPPLAAKLVASMRLANLEIFLTGDKDSELKGMGTTASVIGFDSGYGYIAHVGDSRIYRARSGHLERLTEDHTWLNELIQDHEITEDQVKDFERKNVITRALGLSPKVKIDVRAERVRKGDIYLLCSDGLSDSFNDDVIKDILFKDSEDLELSAVCLIAKAKELGGSDNITAVLVKVNETDENNVSLPPVAATIAEENEKIAKLEKRILKRKRNDFVSKDKNKKGTKEKSQSFIQKNYLPISAVLAIFLFGLGYLTRGAFKLTNENALEFKNPIQQSNDENINVPKDKLKLAKMEGLAESQVKKASQGQNALIALVYFDDVEQYKRIKEDFGKVLDIVSVHPSEMKKNGGGYKVNIQDSKNRTIYTNNRLSLPQLYTQKVQGSPVAQGQPESMAAQMPDEISQELPQRTLASRSRNFGTIFLVGFNSKIKFQNAGVFLNDRFAGKLQTFSRDGLRLPQGSYTIDLRDSLGNILHRRDGISIKAGDVKALEFQLSGKDTTIH